MRYQNLAQLTQAGGWLLGLVGLLSGCVSTTPTTDLPSLPCPVAFTPVVPSPISQDQTADNAKNQAIMVQTLQKRLQERERTIATQTQQIGALSSQLEALRQIDLETHRQPRKRLIYPIP
jgi:hypothetical protein